MGNISETSQWVENINQIEPGEHVTAGFGGVANRALGQLADRTQFLKDNSAPLMSAGRINNPLVHLPLKNGFNMPYGTGSVSFARSTTATYIDRYGVVQHAAADEPRFEKEGLLIEGSSTNLCLHSEDFSNAVWSKNDTGHDVVVTANATTAPDKSTNASKLLGAASGPSVIRELIGITATTDAFVASIFIKAGDAEETCFNVYFSGGTEYNAYLYWDDKHLTGNTSTLVALNNGWYKWSMRIEDTSGTLTGISYRLWPSGRSVSNKYIYAWGAQLEPLPFASSYNPTTTAAVTRTADVCSLTYAGNMPDETVGADRTLLIDFSFLGQHNSMQTIFYSNYAGDYLVRYPTDTVGIVKSRINSNLLYSSVFAAFDGTKYRGGLVSDGVKSLYYINGSLEDSANIVYRDIQTQVELRLGVNASSDQLFGHLSNFRIWDEALTEQEMRIA